MLVPERDGRVYHRQTDYQKQTKHFRAATCKLCGLIFNCKKGKCPNCAKGDPRIARLVF
jgi:predicted Zn-ribbon and HTH transcriptional regulator